MNALVTTTRTVTKTPIDKTALEQFIGMLPLLLIILGMFIILLVVVKMTLKDESTSPMMDCDLSNNISNQLMRQIVKESEFYYKNNRRQMIAIFICALISCFAGLVRGERPMLDDKYNLKKHPNVKWTEDGGAPPYDYAKAPRSHDDLNIDIERLDDYELLCEEDILGKEQPF